MANHTYPSQTPTRRAWQGMMNRCYTKTNKDYPTVGGAGITVIPEWHDYNNFLADMGEKPAGAILARYVSGLGFTRENTYWKQKVYARTNRLYGIWKGLRRRCGVICNSKGAHGEDYSKRGVVLWQDWAESFETFRNDVGEPPSDKHQLDRIDNDAGYVPGNVRWVLPKDNMNNTSSNVVIEMYGMRKTLQQWCEFYGVPRNVVSGRWNLLFTPAKRKGSACQQISVDTGEVIAEFESASAAAAATGIKRGTILKCLSGGNATAGGFAWRYIR